MKCTISEERFANINSQIPRRKLSDEQKEQLKLCFELMDADGSGAIDDEEMGSAFKASAQPQPVAVAAQCQSCRRPRLLHKPNLSTSAPCAAMRGVASVPLCCRGCAT